MRYVISWLHSNFHNPAACSYRGVTLALVRVQSPVGAGYTYSHPLLLAVAFVPALPSQALSLALAW